MGIVEVLEAFVGEMTVSEICARTGRSVDELLAFCTGSQRPKIEPTGSTDAKPTGLTVPKKTLRKRANSLDLVGFEERLMKLLGREGTGHGGRELADASGAPVPKVRDALKRLAAAKRVRFAGETRARRYWAT